MSDIKRISKNAIRDLTFEEISLISGANGAYQGFDPTGGIGNSVPGGVWDGGIGTPGCMPIPGFGFPE